MREPLTETTRAALTAAQQAARERRQDFVGTEHLMLGVLTTDGEATRVLRTSHAKLQDVSAALAATLPIGAEQPVVTGDLPLSPKAQRVINGAIVKAQSMRETRVSTRFLLLSLMDELPAAVKAALTSSGADLESLMPRMAAKPEVAEL
jgi:ATP-dependent Clp protease ATP-binding subunit ClpC